MLAAHYLDILHLHIGCVLLSGALFAVRGVLRLGDVALANHRVVRTASYLIDSLLLGAAVALTTIIHQYPLSSGWLSMKVALLLVYIVLGSLALKRGRTPRGRALAFVAALSCYGLIISIALSKQPLGILASLAGA